MDKIQKAISNTKCNILSFLSDKYYLGELFEMYHGVTLRDAKGNDMFTKELKFTDVFLERVQEYLQGSQMQNEQRDKKLQSSLSPSSLSIIHSMVECIQVSSGKLHEMVYHEEYFDL